jgi:hypothetical protein
MSCGTAPFDIFAQQRDDLGISFDKADLVELAVLRKTNPERAEKSSDIGYCRAILDDPADEPGFEVSPFSVARQETADHVAFEIWHQQATVTGLDLVQALTSTEQRLRCGWLDYTVTK